ncbi:MAG: hypothetical protein ACO3GP_07975, partial [Candidatus Limnocylindrus sp.]
MLENYETVAERLARWLDMEHQGQPRVITHLISNPGDDICVFRAELWVDGTLISTGWAEEVRGQGNVNKTSHLENCESSSLGRALANAGLAGSSPANRPTREEMAKVQRGAPIGSDTRPLQGKATDKQIGLLRSLYNGAGRLLPANINEL